MRFAATLARLCATERVARTRRWQFFVDAVRESPGCGSMHDKPHGDGELVLQRFAVPQPCVDLREWFLRGNYGHQPQVPAGARFVDANRLAN